MQLDAGHLLVQWGVTTYEGCDQAGSSNRAPLHAPEPNNAALALALPHACQRCICVPSAAADCVGALPLNLQQREDPVTAVQFNSLRPAVLVLQLSSCTFLPDTVCTGTTFSLPASRNARCHWGSLTLAGSHGPSFSSFPTDVAASIVSFRPLPHFS
jgi:hypothetical protein